MTENNIIRRWRTSQGISQRELGERLGVQDAAVTKWEQGRVSAEKALPLHNLTGIPLYVLRPDIYPAPPAGGAT